ncbi:MAG: hypothetical protein JWO33_2599, partial [Caulobacteraceae bacterium]|nr:hypothetical protein [Caulobacteraceae bacterium]
LFEKVDGAWLLAHRKVSFDWISEKSMAAPTDEAKRVRLWWMWD